MKKLLTILFIGITVVAQSQTKIDTIGINKLNGALKKLNALNEGKTKVDYFYDIRIWIQQKLLQVKQR